MRLMNERTSDEDFNIKHVIYSTF